MVVKCDMAMDRNDNLFVLTTTTNHQLNKWLHTIFEQSKCGEKTKCWPFDALYACWPTFFKFATMRKIAKLIYSKPFILKQKF